MSKKTIRTPEKRAKFLEALSLTGNVSKSCDMADIARAAVYQWRNAEEEFAQAWDSAQDIGTDALEDEATRRASDGTLKPVFFQGNQCGVVREYSDTLMIFLLKARRPDRFKERTSNEHIVDDLRSKTADDLRRELDELRANSRDQNSQGTA